MPNAELAAIPPGETLKGFTVILPERDDAYVRKDEFGVPTGVVLDFFSTLTGKTDYFGPIKLLDTTPPELSLSANPSTLWPPNGKLADITVDVRARDDYDGRPEIVLESITTNEPLQEGDIEGADYGEDDRMFRLAAKRAGASADGRIYTITYSATDAVGNRGEKTVTVTVPHDRR